MRREVGRALVAPVLGVVFWGAVDFEVAFFRVDDIVAAFIDAAFFVAADFGGVDFIAVIFRVADVVGVILTDELFGVVDFVAAFFGVKVFLAD